MKSLKNIGIDLEYNALRKIFNNERLGDYTPHYNPDLQMDQYGNFLERIFVGDDRGRDELSDVGRKFLKYSPYLRSQTEIRAATHILLFPQPENIIHERQKLVQYFASLHQGQSKQGKRIVPALNSLINRVSYENGSYSNKSKLNIYGNNFSETTSLMQCLADLLSDSEITHDFGADMKSLVESHDIHHLAKFFSRNEGRILFEKKSGVNLARVKQGKQGLENSVDLGFFEYQGEDFYPGAKDHVQKMLEFKHDVAPLVYLLAALYHQGTSYFAWDAQGKPACFPEINNEGRFMIKNCFPIGTHTDTSSAVNVDFQYSRDDKNILLSGPHSGGKTELLKNIGVSHIVGLSGLWLPAEKAEIPLTDRIITSFSKKKEQNMGSLESELREIDEVINGLKPRDLVLWDEFIDTTKPELAKYLEEPFLRRFAQSPASVLLVSHRAARLSDDVGFRLMYPELKEEDVLEWDAKTEQYKTTGEKMLVPTHKFLSGRPDPALVRKHSMQMLNKLRKRNASLSESDRSWMMNSFFEEK